MKTKPVCNHSSVSHAASAASKYRRARLFCILADLVAMAITFIVVPEARFYWLAVWAPSLSYVNWRYWLRLSRDGYFECARCRKLKHTRHIKSYTDTSGETHIWCDMCLSALVQTLRALRVTRNLVAGFLQQERASGFGAQYRVAYRPMPKPTLQEPKTPFSDASPEPKVVVAFRKLESQDLEVSSPGFAKR